MVCFAITYPQEGDTVPLWNGGAGSRIPMTWSYNSTDDIYIPLSIYFVQAGPHEEVPDKAFENVNITSKAFDIDATFKAAAYFLVRVIHGQDYYESGHFDISLSNRGSETESAGSSVTVTATLITVTTSAPSASSTSSEAESSSSSSVTSKSAAPSSYIHTNSSHLDTEQKVGVGVGVAVFIGLVAGLLFMYRRRRRTQTAVVHGQTDHSIGPAELSVAEAQIQQRHELDGEGEKRPLPVRATASEVPG
ncbi:hypothetical protein BBP40_010498 [Aspergillus hancockii]|nr:hypothetical protein BBP40_010498 [Aspergillus hancockii]